MAIWYQLHPETGDRIDKFECLQAAALSNLPGSKIWLESKTRGVRLRCYEVLQRGRMTWLRDEPVPTRTVYSMMNPNGKPIVIPFNTPLYLDPSSETYWSM